MISLWSESDAAGFSQDPLALRVYTSRLLGQEPALVLHGGGNTSVKVHEKDFFGDPVEICYVKGSGWDLATIEKPGFSPVRVEICHKLAKLAQLSDTEMVRQLRAGMTDPGAPTPSIEAILHGVLPFTYVDHTHANAVVALTNSGDGEANVRACYGDRVLVVPYVMPGFILAKTIYDLIQGRDLTGIEGIILLQHGIFTFYNDAKTSYELMIKLVSEAEQFFKAKAPQFTPAIGETISPDLLGLAELRRCISKAKGRAQIASTDRSFEAVGFSNLSGVADFGCRGPLTPDHIIRTKLAPLVVGSDIGASVADYTQRYQAYFDCNNDGTQTILDPAPRVAVWPGQGVVTFGDTVKDAGIVGDIARHTRATIQLAEACGGWNALPENELFRMEYWELEQAKLRGGGSKPEFQGKVAIVTGSAAGIGFACAESLAKRGAVVIGLDLNPEIESAMASIGAIGMVVNLTDDAKVLAAIEQTVGTYGGLDIVVSNAGIFTAGQYLEDLDSSNWEKSLAVNLTSHQKLLKYTIPYLKKGIDSAIVIVGSRNVAAPGAGAASYSCAKAAVTQLCRVASMELAPFGVRCNIIHPDAVFDTKLWTPEALKRSAERYGLTVEEYKTRNLMKTEIRSRDVGEMVATMSGTIFGKTTGAQVPVDGGNDRVI